MFYLLPVYLSLLISHPTEDYTKSHYNGVPELGFKKINSQKKDTYLDNQIGNIFGLNKSAARKMSSDGVVNCFMNDRVIEALEVESEDILICWVLTEDGLWQLCIQCDECESWLQYPWVDHPCMDLETMSIAVETAPVEQVIETTMDELTEGLL